MMEFLKHMYSYSELESELLKVTGDSPLIRKHATIKETLSLKHYKGHKLPSLPLIMLVHGLGGQLNQFEHLIEFFSHFAEVLSLDLPGHGQSDHGRDWKSYTTDRLVDTLETVLNANTEESREVVLIGHSYGTVLAAKLAIRLGIRCVGLITISPLVELSEKARKSQAMAGYTPTIVFDAFRVLDRLGGLNSHSVSRQVDSSASDKIRRRQLRWNLQANTLTVLNCIYSLTPVNEQEWKKIECPVFIIVAENDSVIPAKYGQILHSWLRPRSSDIKPATIRHCGHAVMIERPEILCGLIGDFITKQVDIKLSLGWQLAYLAARDDKWSLKNEGKWRAIQNVSPIIKGTRFRAMKTLRQDDEIHNPIKLEQEYPDILDIIDISRERPPYDPSTFTRVKYHKFPTVSKLPPTVEEVDEFIKLTEEISARRSSEGIEDSIIVVHCHYGFNRTGFFLCCNMIEKFGFSVKEAVANFKEARDPGIKHVHFIDELYVRYELK
ncbi:alpha/beta-hydrolase [Nadsonia fulvescens var. elongata DSM 6958]|uniref:Alpha/beta-hydrolase n=1 Tax=Nadsonia fulvescens var. elongata DSM 6958 TaxID=857566 RepID=A0A1E3PF33_9ASCO|nr:alpha/beta-hydrolase [Nadsonia fulvescens var. elongata DSM 6958]